jgi:hypothetical protein
MKNNKIINKNGMGGPNNMDKKPIKTTALGR